VLGGVDFRESVDFELLPWLEPFLAFFVILLGFAAFICLLLAFVTVLLLDDLLELCWAFWVF
jgi:hypothetical protein